eukprot:Filipodium_phascolosomae@DN2121_c0_g1_i4.p1
MGSQDSQGSTSRMVPSMLPIPTSFERLAGPDATAIAVARAGANRPTVVMPAVIPVPSAPPRGMAPMADSSPYRMSLDPVMRTPEQETRDLNQGRLREAPNSIPPWLQTPYQSYIPGESRQTSDSMGDPAKGAYGGEYSSLGQHSPGRTLGHYSNNKNTAAADPLMYPPISAKNVSVNFNPSSHSGYANPDSYGGLDQAGDRGDWTPSSTSSQGDGAQHYLAAYNSQKEKEAQNAKQAAEWKEQIRREEEYKWQAVMRKMQAEEHQRTESALRMAETKRRETVAKLREQKEEDIADLTRRMEEQRVKVLAQNEKLREIAVKEAHDKERLAQEKERVLREKEALVQLNDRIAREKVALVAQREAERRHYLKRKEERKKKESVRKELEEAAREIARLEAERERVKELAHREESQRKKLAEEKWREIAAKEEERKWREMRRTIGVEEEEEAGSRRVSKSQQQKAQSPQSGNLLTDQFMDKNKFVPAYYAMNTYNSKPSFDAPLRDSFGKIRLEDKIRDSYKEFSEKSVRIAE